MEHLGWGLQMTVLGMGLVFSLLIMLWGLLNLVLTFENNSENQAIPPETTTEEGHTKLVGDGDVVPIATEPTTNDIPNDLAAAIMIAVLQHKTKLCRKTANSQGPGNHLAGSWVAAGRARQLSSWQRRAK
jgi:glutaconyl-CoA/methylmalonyl-CoA decarboxylase subunit delta